MITVTNKTSIFFDEFINWYPDNSENRYQLNRGIINEMPKPRGKHSQIAGDLTYHLRTAFRDANQSYFIPRECIVKISNDTGYEPDIIILDEKAIADEFLKRFLTLR